MTWHECRLADLGRVVTGKTPSRKRPDYFGEEHPFITPSDFDFRHYYCTEVPEGISEIGFEKHKNQFIPQDAAMCVCIGSTIGKCAIAPELCLTNQQINSIIVHEGNDSKFIYYLLCNIENQIRAIGLAGGAAKPIINKSNFSALKVRVPNTTTQVAIAGFLSEYDDLIENNRRRIALLEESARLLYREWFVHLRFPGHEHIKIIDGLPEGWERRTLGDVVDVVKENVKPSDFKENDIHIGLEHIPRRSFTLADWESAEGLASAKWRFKGGDILFCKIRPYFHKVGFTVRSGLTSLDAMVWRVKDETDWPIALSAASSDHFVAVASKTVREGSKMPRADWKVLRDYSILKPPIGLLEIFNEAIRTTAAQCKTLVFQNNALTQARDLLLPRVMNGGIAV